MAESATATQPTSAGAPRSRVVKNSAILTGYAVVDAAMLFVLNMLLGRYLGVSDFGKYSFASACGMVLWVFSDPGISLTITKLVARNPDPKSREISDGLSLRMLLVAAGCTVGVAPLFLSPYVRANAMIILPFLWAEQIRGLTLTVGAIFRGFQVMTYEVIAVACERMATLTLVLWMLHHGEGVGTVAWGFLIGRSLAFVVAMAILTGKIGRVRLTLRPKMAASLFKEALPLASMLFAERVNLYYSPIALTAIVGEYAAGLFQAAYKVVTFPIMLIGSVGGALYPAMAAAHGEHAKVQKIYRYGVRAVWHMILPGAALTIAFAPDVLRIIYGAQFEPAARVLQMLTPYFIVYGVITISYYLMPAINEQRITMQLSFISLALNLAIGPLCMWIWKAPGAAAGLVVSNLCVAGVYWYRAHRLGYHLMRMRADVFQWAGFALTVGAGFTFRHFVPVRHWYELAIAAAVVTFVYCGALLATSSFLPEEIEMFKSMKSRVLGTRAIDAAESLS